MDNGTSETPAVTDEVKEAAVVEETAASPITGDAAVTGQDEPSEPDSPMIRLPTFRLTHEGESMDIEAVDEISARAFFNDRRAKWPMPRDVKCVPVVPTDSVASES